MSLKKERIKSQLVFGAVEQLSDVMRSKGLSDQACVLISDSNVSQLHASRLCEILEKLGCEILSITIPAGETSKSRSQYDSIIDELLSIPIDRSTPIIALGGGVVGDLSGFVAATLFRGVPFFQIPTTLIAQVDSSIGGKTGINHTQGKNLVGSFYPAEAIIVDVDLLNTLPDRELQNGLAEVIKAAFIRSVDFVNLLSSKQDLIKSRDAQTLDQIVQMAAKIKIDIVEEDEFESGIRAHLNFGHTFAHGIENTLGYGEIGHGEAVGIGMIAALLLSMKIDPNLDFQKEIDLVKALVNPRPISNLDWASMESAFLRDKKRTQGISRFIILDKLGSAQIRSDINLEDVRKSLETALELV